MRFISLKKCVRTTPVCVLDTGCHGAVDTKFKTGQFRSRVLTVRNSHDDNSAIICSNVPSLVRPAVQKKRLDQKKRYSLLLAKKIARTDAG